MAESVRMIAGLGNPGKEYSGTRHNAGFEVVDLLAEKLGVKIKQKKFGALFAELFYEDKKLILLKPQQYMNRSGQVIATAQGFYKLGLSNLLVVTDEMALEPGMIRLRANGSAGGHNGLRDIMEILSTDDFARLRVGIGKSGFSDSSDYVLEKPSADERVLIDGAIEKAREAALCWVTEGVDSAMNKFNANEA